MHSFVFTYLKLLLIQKLKSRYSPRIISSVCVSNYEWYAQDVWQFNILTFVRVKAVCAEAAMQHGYLSVAFNFLYCYYYITHDEVRLFTQRSVFCVMAFFFPSPFGDVTGNFPLLYSHIFFSLHSFPIAILTLFPQVWNLVISA